MNMQMIHRYDNNHYISILSGDSTKPLHDLRVKVDFQTVYMYPISISYPTHHAIGSVNAKPSPIGDKPASSYP